ncbi:hypothetical protein EON77_20800, partial [bacterium]
MKRLAAAMQTARAEPDDADDAQLRVARRDQPSALDPDPRFLAKLRRIRKIDQLNLATKFVFVPAAVTGALAAEIAGWTVGVPFGGEILRITVIGPAMALQEARARAHAHVTELRRDTAQEIRDRIPASPEYDASRAVLTYMARQFASQAEHAFEKNAMDHLTNSIRPFPYLATVATMAKAAVFTRDLDHYFAKTSGRGLDMLHTERAIASYVAFNEAFVRMLDEGTALPTNPVLDLLDAIYGRAAAREMGRHALIAYFVTLDVDGERAEKGKAPLPPPSNLNMLNELFVSSYYDQRLRLGDADPSRYHAGVRGLVDARRELHLDPPPSGQLET